MTENKIPNYPEATEEMWDWQDSINENSNKNYRRKQELEQMKKGLADAVIAFGIAVKEANEQILKMERETASADESLSKQDVEFQRRFGQNRYQIDWSMRK